MPEKSAPNAPKPTNNPTEVHEPSPTRPPNKPTPDHPPEPQEVDRGANKERIEDEGE